MRQITWLIHALIFAQTCFSQDINPASPELLPFDYSMDSLPVSVINIPIKINLKPFFAMAEKSVDTVYTSKGFPEEWEHPDCSFKYQYALRRSPLKISGEKHTLSLGFMGYYKMGVSTRLCINNIALSPWSPPLTCGFDDGERKVDVLFTNKMMVYTNYMLKSEITAHKPKPIDPCKISALDIDITGQVLGNVEKELNNAKKEIEKNYGNINLRPYFQQLWDKLLECYPISSLGHLRINPKNLYINQMVLDNDKLNLALGLLAKPIVAKSNSQPQPQKIPDLIPHKPTNGFYIYLDAILNYDSLSNILNERIQLKEFHFKKAFIKKTIIIQKCSLKGIGEDKLYVKIDFSGSAKGSFYLIARPVYNIRTRELELEDISFDIKSKDALLKTADWIFNRRIEIEIQKNTKYQLGGYIDMAKLQINTALNKELSKGITSRGNAKEILIDRFFALQNHLVVRCYCNGEMAITVNNISL